MTSPDLSAAAWVQDVTEQDLIEQVGMITLRRAETYVAEGRIRTLVAGPGGMLLLATVVGSGSMVYQAILRREAPGSTDWYGQCSCPVVVDCKHVVAALLEARRRLGTPGASSRPAWEVALTPLVRGSEQRARDAKDRPAGSSPLALQVSLSEGHYAGAETRRVMLRPLKRGRGTRWIKTGVGWRDLGSQWSSPEVLPAHRMVVSQLHAVVRGGSSYYQYATEEIALGEAGQLAWPLLRACVASGVELVAGRGVSGVRLGDGTATIAVDVTRGEDGSMTLRPFLAVDDEPVRDGPRFVVGRPGHGVGHLDGSGALTLWPLAEAPVEEAVSLLEQDQVVVPAEDVDRFLALFYPLVSQQLRLSSLDGSVPEAQASRPGLVLTLRPAPEHVLDLEWALSYAVPSSSGGSASVLVPLTGEDGVPTGDGSVVAEVLAGVVPALAAMPSLVERPLAGAPRPRATVTLTGHPTALFVTQVLPLLREHEEVEIRVEGELPDYAEVVEAPVVHLETVVGSTEDWFDLHVTVTVGGREVPFEELFAALARHDPVLMLADGTWFSLDHPELDQLRRLIEEARELADRPSEDGTVRLSPYQAGLWEELVKLGVVEAQSEAWSESVDALLALGEADRGTIGPPEGLAATLRPYQLDGYRWLATLWDAGLGGILADDMGLGKTLQVLATVARAEHRGDLAPGPVLVVAPTSVVGTWAAEAARFAPGLRVATIEGTRRRRGHDLETAVAGADLVITSYTLLRLEGQGYADLPWSAVVLDEAQFVKNHRSATYQAVRRLGVRRTFALTGTPLENTLMDLWSMTSLAAPGLFPRPEVFTERYRKPVDTGDQVALARLRRRIRPFMLRRTKAEVATELPAKTEQVLQVALHPAHQRVYDKHLQRERQRVLGLLEDMDKNRMAIFKALTILRQLALDPSLVDDAHEGLAVSAKVSTLVERLEEIRAEGHRALVFSSFTGYLAKVREALEADGIGYSYLDGRTRNRAARIAGFKEGDDPVFLISLKAGGFGLTLTEADYVFVLDPWWNPAAEAQAVDRTHRIGQTRPVNVYRMVSTGTIEEKVVALQERKRHLFDTVVDSGAFRSGAITAKDIQALLAD